MAASLLYSLYPLILTLLLTLVSLPSTSSNVEVDILIELKNSLTDPNHALDSWDENLVDPCTWLHVTCDEDNRLTQLNIMRLNLSGQLVPNLGNLEFLNYMLIYGNNIHGSIPVEFGNLKNLIDMDLSENNLTGTIPSSLGNLKSLKFLRLNDNHLTGKIPQEVIDLHLQVLNVTNNNLS